MLQLFKGVAGEFLDICERSGKFKLSNISLQDIYIVGLFPSGDYRAEVTFFDATDDLIFKLFGTARLRVPGEKMIGG